MSKEDIHLDEEQESKEEKWYEGSTYKQRRQTAKKINAIIQDHKKWRLRYQSIAPLREPVMFLIRRGGSVEYYDNVKETTFTVPDTPQGEDKKIHLNERKLLTFKYGKHTFKGYICHEDHAFPLPSKKSVDAALMEAVVYKMFINYEKLKAGLERARWTGISKAIWAIAGLVLAYAFYKWWTGQADGTEIQQAAQAVNAAANTVPTETLVLGG